MILPTNSTKAFADAGSGARTFGVGAAVMPMMITITPCQPGTGRTRAT
jgi:hypothetical protein